MEADMLVNDYAQGFDLVVAVAENAMVAPGIGCYRRHTRDPSCEPFSLLERPKMSPSSLGSPRFAQFLFSFEIMARLRVFGCSGYFYLWSSEGALNLGGRAARRQAG